MSKKYMLYPGFVRSKNDGDEHYMSAARLAELYSVPFAECVDYSRQQDWVGRSVGDLIALRVRTGGNYQLPAALTPPTTP